MSTALARLRLQFNDELLVRVGRDYELTPQARLLLPQLQRTIPLVQKALMSQGEFNPERDSNTYRFVMSDYSATQLKKLLSRILELAPGIEFEIVPLPESPSDGPHELWISDYCIGPTGMGFEGESLELFSDEYVCVISSSNSALEDGLLTWEKFTQLPQVACNFGRNQMTMAERVIRDLGFGYSANIITRSFLPIPAIVSGTNQVGIIPRRLEKSIPKDLNVSLVPLPFGKVELHQRLWWHESKNDEPPHAWLRKTIKENLDLVS